jgi:hypothetical protein
MKIIIDTDKESPEGLSSAIRVLSSLLREKRANQNSGNSFASENISWAEQTRPIPETPLQQDAKSKAEEGFINIFAGESLPPVENKEKENELSADDFDFETY